MISIEIMEQNQPGWFALAIIRNLCGMFNVEMMSFQENEIRSMSVSKRPFYVHFVPEKGEEYTTTREYQFRETITYIGAISPATISAKAGYSNGRGKARKGQKTPDWKRIKIFGEANVGETARMLDDYSRDGGPIFRCQGTHVEGIANIGAKMEPVCREILKKEAEIYPKYNDSIRLEDTSHFKTFMAGMMEKQQNGKRVKRSSSPEALPSESKGVHIRWSQWEFAVAFERSRDIAAKRQYERDKARANRERVAQQQERERRERFDAVMKQLFED